MASLTLEKLLIREGSKLKRGNKKRLKMGSGVSGL